MKPKKKKKKNYGARVFWAPVFFLKFFGGKNNFLTVVIREKTSRKKK